MQVISNRLTSQLQRVLNFQFSEALNICRFHQPYQTKQLTQENDSQTVIPPHSY